MTARRTSLLGRWRMYDDQAALLFLVYNTTFGLIELTLDMSAIRNRMIASDS